MPKFILNINAVTDKIYTDDNIVCYVLDASLPKDYIKNFDSSGKMVLLGGDNAAQLNSELATDGILADISSDLPIKAQVGEVRRQSGNRKVLGAVIAARRHEAMLVSETEPDFVAFRFSAEQKEYASEVIKWYNELFLIQSAVDLRNGITALDNVDCDFVIINSQDYANFGC